MWIPETAAELEEAARAGTLRETPPFDGKVALPAPKRNVDLAIDVAAMTTEGGVVIYGLGEDEHKRLTVLEPFELAGAAERVDQIVQTSIVEVPQIEMHELRLEATPERGYLVVVVPRSSRAPHQVVVGKDFRFYGRGATGNRLLTEGEVAALYARRARWDVDREAVLSETIQAAPFDPIDELVFLHGFVRPVAAEPGLVARAADNQPMERFLLDLVKETHQHHPAQGYEPDLARAMNVVLRGADGWIVQQSHPEDKPQPARTMFADIGRNGNVHFFCGRAGDILDGGRRVTFEVSIAGNTATALALAGLIYQHAGYVGDVDIGVALTNLQDTVSFAVHRGGFATPFTGSWYRRTARIRASLLRDDPRQVVRSLYQELFELTYFKDADPFE